MFITVAMSCFISAYSINGYKHNMIYYHKIDCKKRNKYTIKR